MILITRLVALVVLLGVFTFCLFGFLATSEPMDAGARTTWRIVYGLGGLLAATRMIRILVVMRSRPVAAMGPAHEEGDPQEVLHTCRVKAARTSGDKVGLGFHWMRARRGILVVGKDELRCGDWHIPYPEIEAAVLYSMPWMWMKAHVLAVRTAQGSYQFGLNPRSYWDGPLPFPVVRRSGGWTWRAVNVLRILVLPAAVIYFIWAFNR